MTIQYDNTISQRNYNQYDDNLNRCCSTFSSSSFNLLDSFSDVLKVAECSLKWIQISGSFKKAENQLNYTVGSIEKVRAVIGFKDIPATVESTWTSFTKLYRIQNAVDSSQMELADARYNAFKSSLEITAMTTDTAVALNDLKVVDLGRGAVGCSGLFFGVDIISNVLNIREKIDEINQRFVESIKGRISEVRRLEISKKDFLSKIQLFNNITCLVGSVVGLVGLIIGGSPVLTVIGLASSTFWIVTKIFSKFYQELLC